VQAEVHPDAVTIFGATFDDSLEDEIRVTVIATGFEEKASSSGTAAVPNGGSAKANFESVIQAQVEEPKNEEKDPFEDILKIFSSNDR